MKHDIPQDDNAIRLTTLSQIKTFSDPYRMLIFKTFSNSEEAVTIKRVADIMGEVPAKVYYHAKKLIQLGVLELDHEENINGIIAKYYRTTNRRIIMSHDSLDDSQMPFMLSETEKMVSNVFDDTKSEFIEAMQAISKRAPDGKDSDEGEGGLIVSRIHLTKSEAESLYRYLMDLSEKKKAAESDDTVEYLFFNGLIELPSQDHS